LGGVAPASTCGRSIANAGGQAHSVATITAARQPNRRVRAEIID
jgi:hypothetical protein